MYLIYVMEAVLVFYLIENPTFFERFTVTMDPFFKVALYTIPNPPCPIIFEAEKFPVALEISSKDNSERNTNI